MSWLRTFVDLLFYALYLAILARIVLSWLNASPYSPIVSFIYQITDPILLPLRRIVPPLGMIDVTPLLAIMLLSLVRELLVRTLSGLL